MDDHIRPALPRSSAAIGFTLPPAAAATQSKCGTPDSPPPLPAPLAAALQSVDPAQKLLGTRANTNAEAGSALSRQAKAKRHDLEMPLLEYAQFPSLLRAAVRLGMIQLSEQDIAELNEVRKRTVHGARHSVIDDRSDCARMTRTLQTARGAIRSAARRQVSFDVASTEGNTRV